MWTWSLHLPHSIIQVPNTCCGWGKGLCPASLLREENCWPVDLLSGPHLWSCQVVSSEGEGCQLVHVPRIVLQPYIASLVPGFPPSCSSSTCSGCSCPRQPQAGVCTPLEIKQGEIPATSKAPVSLCHSHLLCFLCFVLWAVFGGCACP